MRVKKIFNRLLSVALCAVTMISVGAGCKNDKDDSGVTDGAQTQQTEYNGRGVHKTSVNDRADYLIQNGQSDYKIVLPVEYRQYEMEGAVFLADYIKRATGVDLEIIFDDKAEVTASGKFISIGNTKLMRNSGISVPYDEFGSSGFRIVTKKNVVYIATASSPSAQGALYGAQEFLAQTIDFRVYTLDEVKFSYTDSIRMKDFDITEIPEFDNRRLSFRSVNSNTSAAKLMRISINTDNAIPYSGHSHFSVLPPENYEADHPDWYYHPQGKSYEQAGKNDFYRDAQLCVTNEEMIAEFIKQLALEFQRYPDANFVHLGIQDNQEFCKCENCTGAMEKYNTNAAGVSNIFMNKVARGVTEIIQSTQPNRQLTFETFAYYAVMTPPVHRDENGEWVPDHEEVILDDNIVIQFAPINSNANESFDHQLNDTYMTYLKNYSLVCKSISTWCYATNFRWLLITHNDWDVFKDNLLIYSQAGVDRFYNQASHNTPYTQAWEELKVYVESKLMWDVTLDYNELVAEFIENYYGDAAEQIQELYDLVTMYAEYAHSALGISGNIYFTLDNKKYWTYSYVESYRMLLEKALIAIEPLKEIDVARYQKLYDRIVRFKVENIYMQMEYYIDNYSQEHIKAAVTEFSELCSKFNIDYMDESRTLAIQTIITKWSASYA